MMPSVGGTTGASAKPPVPIRPVKRGSGNSGNTRPRTRDRNPSQAASRSNRSASPSSVATTTPSVSTVTPATRSPRRTVAPSARACVTRRLASRPRRMVTLGAPNAAAWSDWSMSASRRPRSSRISMAVVAMPRAATSPSRPIARSPFIPLGARVRKTPSPAIAASSRASRTVTAKPSRARRAASVRPATPPPQIPTRRALAALASGRRFVDIGSSV